MKSVDLQGWSETYGKCPSDDLPDKLRSIKVIPIAMMWKNMKNGNFTKLKKWNDFIYYL